ncbi:MAG: hypothetical protein NTU53_18195 [Planctomycetota bacterium]|nr:hypothetical protein [Planctomycetota bacterium]
MAPTGIRLRAAMAAAMTLLAAAIGSAAEAKKGPYRLPSTERLTLVLWGAECLVPDGLGLAFGGEDQKAEDGAARTRIRVGGEWQPIVEQLRNSNPLQKDHGRAWAIRNQVKDALAKLRFIYFEGASDREQAKAAEAEALPLLRAATAALGKLTTDLSARAKSDRAMDEYHRSQIGHAVGHFDAARGLIALAEARLAEGIGVDDIKALHRGQIQLELAAEVLDAEPPPRALSPIVYDPASKLFILFGGDHLDYLTNDTWVFDFAKRQWRQRHPKLAPPPRANHQLAMADGKLKLGGGYTYFNDIWYMGGPYIDVDDDPWTYDVAADAWTSAAGAVADSRAYRQKEFHPDFFLQGDRPDAAAFAAKLKELPSNTWVLTKPPQLPRVNRDWGTAVIDPDHDVLLRWSGGHCAHGGSDVLLYHFATNRWELPYPVEFPLGQTYSNTSYPGGVNLNHRPWVTGHTYKSYDFDPASKAMVFVGPSDWFHVFDPAVGDWNGRGQKPAGMSYDDGFYDLMCKRTPLGVVCWTKRGQLFRFDAKAGRWEPLTTTGLTLPGSAVDSAGIDYDSRRDRLLLFPGKYAKPYTGQIITVDLKTLAAANADPMGMAGAAMMPRFQRESCYVGSADLVLIGVTLAPGEDGVRWTPAYDCATNRWLGLRIDGPNPAGKDGRNVSLGLVYDAKRNLIWAVDADSHIYVLRLETKTAAKKAL